MAVGAEFNGDSASTLSASGTMVLYMRFGFAASGTLAEEYYTTPALKMTHNGIVSMWITPNIASSRRMSPAHTCFSIVSEWHQLVD